MNKLLKKPPFVIRILLPLIVVLVWLGLSGVGGPYFGRIDEVASNDQSNFLPQSAESTRVNAELKKFNDTQTLPAIAVFTSDTPLVDTQQTAITKAIDAVNATKLPADTISPPITSEDGKAAFIVVPLAADADFKKVIPELKGAIAATNPGLTFNLTGPAVFVNDLSTAFAGIDGILLIVALSVVFVILFVVYRSPILPVVTLVGALIALSTAILAVWNLAANDIIQLNGQVQGILFILVIGAATDYSLLYISRYREELIRHESKWDATKAAWKASWEPIVAAGGTVIVGLLCLLFSDLGSNKALGPAGGIGILFSIVMALTFLPAVLLLLGRGAFWPRRPLHSGTVVIETNIKHTFWSKIGRLVERYPRRLWIGCSALLIAACLFVPQLKADGVSQRDLVLGVSEAREGQKLLDAHFPAGSGSPAYVLVPRDEQATAVALLDNDQGVDSIVITTNDQAVPTAPVGSSADELVRKIREKIEAQRSLQPPAGGPSVDRLVAQATSFTTLEPRVIDGMVLLQVTLKDSADSIAARSTIERLRSTLKESHPSIAIGGTTAVQLDTNTASERDLRVIIPLILGVITIILMLLLRALVAPLLLLLTTVVSFGATLGTSALLFNNVFGYPGADPSVIIFGFVFLVALGIDYNIFLMSRVREETKRQGVKKGTIAALVVTGGVISSAGIVLASTFAALYVIPILFLAQIAFIVAFGVLLDTLIVRSLIVPGLTIDVGRRMWWPSKLYKKK